jgi:hypothetical protein
MTSIRQSIHRFFTPVKPLPSGIYHYQASPNAPQPYRLHLRLEPDGNGLLMVNASTILHLNQTAAEYAYHLVKGTSPVEAIRQIASRFRVSHNRAAQDCQDLTDRIHALIELPDLDPEMYLGFDRMAPSEGSPSAPYRLDCALTYRLPEGVDPAFAPSKRVERELSTQEWIHVIDKAWSVGIPHIVFTGGEPTLRDDLPELLTHAEENGQVTGLITDGLIFGDTARLETLLQTGLDHVMITLNTDHMAAWTALANALAADLFITVHLTVSLRNALEAGKILNKIAQSGVKHLSLSIDDLSLQDTLLELRNTAAGLNLSLFWDLAVPYSAFNPVALEIQEDISSLEAIPTSLYVEPDGDVLPAQGVNLVLGNLLSDPWERIWQ